MNSQLELHLETFDSDEEFSESPALHEEEHVDPIRKKYDGMMNPISAALLKLKASMRKFVKPRSIREGLEKILWMLPLAIVLGDYIGMVFSTSLSFMIVVLLQLKPEHDNNNNNNNNNGDPSWSDIPIIRSTRSGDSCVISNMKFVDHFKTYGHTKEEAEEVSKVLLQQKKQVQECRQEVSRLLGLAGAPPLEWKNSDDETQQEEEQPQDISTIRPITEIATNTVVQFLEAHVQFLLTIDQAYRSLQITTSLHLGLGPASQCVERVERATIAREFRKNRQARRSNKQQQQQQSGIDVGSASSGMLLLQPQRPGKSPILAVASARKNLAKTMVEQSESLIQVWKGIRRLHQHRGNRSSPRINDDNNYYSSTMTMPNIDQLSQHIPDVVDLTWIKSARHQLAGLISHLMDYFCTMDVLQTISEGGGTGGPRSRLEESMWNARNAKEYLSAALLLLEKGEKDKEKSAKEPMPPSSDNQRLLLQSLMHYRDQLDALQGAIWSQCVLGDDNLPADGKREWWSQVTQLGATCRALEDEIGQKFSLVKVEDDDDDKATTTSDDDDGKEGNDKDPACNESGSYEHGGVVAETTKQGETTTQTRTIVFKGKGAKEEDRFKSSSNNKTAPKSQGTTSKASDGGVPLPPRDTVSELQLVNELKNRIKTICQDTDDEDGDWEDVDPNDVAGRQPATSHFLGATGSLLSELKGSLPLMMMDNNNSIVGEEEVILGE